MVRAQIAANTQYTQPEPKSEEAAALTRLVTHSEAIHAWGQLWKHSKGEDDPCLHLAIGHIVVLARTPRLDPGEKITPAELRKRKRQASTLASELATLIADTPAMQFEGLRLLPENINAALDTLTGTPSGDVDIQDVEISERRGVYDSLEDTRQASGAVLQFRLSNFALQSILKRFIDELSVAAPASGIQLQKKMADANIFSVACSAVLQRYFDQPHHDVVSGLASAVFDESIDTELVKQWWHRKQKLRRAPTAQSQKKQRTVRTLKNDKKARP